MRQMNIARATAVVVIAVSCGCADRHRRPDSPASVVLIRYEPGRETLVHEFMEPEWIDAWQKCFPSYETAYGFPEQPSFWWASVRVFFVWEDGQAAWVAANSNRWSNGKGEFEATADTNVLYAQSTNHIQQLMREARVFQP